MIEVKNVVKSFDGFKALDGLTMNVPDGSIYGIELLNANEQLRAADDGRLVVVDAAGGERSLDLVEAGR